VCDARMRMCVCTQGVWICVCVCMSVSEPMRVVGLAMGPIVAPMMTGEGTLSVSTPGGDVYR